MGRFSDLPHFLLDEYFSESISTSNTSIISVSNSYLHGGRGSIIVDGGYWEKIWIDVKTVDGEEPSYKGLVEYKFKVNNTTYRSEDYFNFEFGSLLTLPASANGTFDSGSDVYFKKGSYIYDWLTTKSEYKEYFNTNKTWLYFGKIFDRVPYENEYRIIFDGMKNFVINCLPEHQRTTNLTEFTRLYFDFIYNKIYNMTKNISTLLDPREIDYDWIDYLAKNYNMDVDIGFTGLPVREWVESLPNLLKRKGTYSSLYILWKVILNNTLNNLNIYGRWHDRDLYSTYGIRSPIGHFKDILHQMTYGYMPTGCSGYKWYRKSLEDISTSAVFEQKTKSSLWKTRHEMYTENIVVQCYDSAYNRIWPQKVEVVNTGLVEITFGNPESGFVFLESNIDYLHSQNDGSIEWIVSHGQNQQEVISQYQTLLFNMMMPKNVTNLEDGVDNSINIDFSDEQDGYCMVLRDGVYVFQKPIADTEWNVTHTLGKKEVMVQTFDLNHNMIQPSMIHLEDDSSLLIEWSPSGVSGYAVLKSVDNEGTLPGCDWSDLILSPHYKVEMDLSCEPLGNDDDPPTIIGEELIDRLIEKWELMRPVTRFSHYHILISPLTDFTSAYTSLYGGTNEAFLFTKFCASSSEFIPSALENEMVYDQYFHSNSWKIIHNFNTRNLIVQCYDKNNNRMWPKSVWARYNNQLEIEFGQSVTGTAALLSLNVSGSLFTESTSAGANPWTINHALNLKEVISQYDTTTYNKIMPSGVMLDDTSNLLATWTTNKNGMGLISSSEIIWMETEPKDVWYIDHRLGCDSVICQFFDDNDLMIQPETITLSNINRIIARFPTDTSGYAIIKSINKAFRESDIMADISYWTLGTGTSGAKYDPVSNNSVETFLASGSDFDLDYDDDFYYLSFETGQKDVDWNITEIAWFDKYNKIRFYTYCSAIHKPKDVWFNSHYRIKRLQA